MIRQVQKIFVICFLGLVLAAIDNYGQNNPENFERIRLIHADWGGGKRIGNRNVRLLVGNVEFRQGDAYMKCQRCTQYPDEGRLDFEDNVEIFNNHKWLFADRVVYYEDPQIEEAEGNVRLVDTTKTLLARKIKYFEKDEKAFADDSVRILDEKNRLILAGNQAEYHRAIGYAKITGSPCLSKKDTTNMIELTITGKEMEMFDDGARVTVKDSVVIERGAVTATCGEVEYLDKEEKVVLRVDPQAKRKWDDLWGDEIVLLLENTEVKAIDIYGQAVVTSKVDTLESDDNRHNFLSGEKIFVWVHDEVMDSVWVTGRATSYYHVIEEDEDKGVNKVMGDEIRLHFSEGELKRVLVPSSPGTTTGTFYPPAQSYLVETELYSLLEKHPTFRGQVIKEGQ